MSKYFRDLQCGLIMFNHLSMVPRNGWNISCLKRTMQYCHLQTELGRSWSAFGISNLEESEKTSEKTPVNMMFLHV